MTETRWVLVKADEDGNPINWIEPGMVGDIAEIMDYYGVERFYDDVPERADPNYWPENVGMLLEVRVLRVKPKTVVETWEVE